MRHQSARVVFVACLTAAYCAAQAPASFRTFESSDIALSSSGGGGSNASSTQTTIATPSWSMPRFDLRTTQDPDYSMRGMFQQAHGMFMAGKSRYEPMASLHFGLYPNQRVNHEPGSFDFIAHGFDADVPLVLSTEGYLMIGAYYKQRHYQFTSSTTLADEDLTGAGVKLGFGMFLDENMLLEVETHPGVWTDAGGGLHHEDYDFPSHALVTFRADDHLFWKVGLRYNQIYADAPVLPYIGVSWDITGMMTPAGSGSEYGGDSWRLDVMLPEYFELSYWPTADTGFMLGTDVWGAEYHVRTPLATGRQRDDLRVQEVTSYLGFVHRFSDMLSLTIKSGGVIAGDTELTNGAAGFQKIDGALDQGFFAHVTFGVDW